MDDRSQYQLEVSRNLVNGSSWPILLKNSLFEAATSTLSMS